MKMGAPRSCGTFGLTVAADSEEVGPDWPVEGARWTEWADSMQ